MPNEDANIEARVAEIECVSIGAELTDMSRAVYVEGVGCVGYLSRDQALVITKPPQVVAYESFVRSLAAQGIPYSL